VIKSPNLQQNKIQSTRQEIKAQSPGYRKPKSKKAKIQKSPQQAKRYKNCTCAPAMSTLCLL